MDGLIDATTEIENRLRKEEDSAAETVDAISREDAQEEIDDWAEMGEDKFENAVKLLKGRIEDLPPCNKKAKEGA